MILKPKIPDDDAECYITKKELTNVISALREQFARSVFAKKCRAKRISKTKGPRGGVRYDCDSCGKALAAKDTELHHVDEVVEIGKHYYSYSLNDLIARLWCGFKGILLLCHDCHYNKYTLPQNILRQEARDLEKAKK